MAEWLACQTPNHKNLGSSPAEANREYFKPFGGKFSEDT